MVGKKELKDIKEPVSAINCFDEKAYQEDLIKLDRLKGSTDREDRVVAILMSDIIGSIGFWENFAREKARAILKELDSVTDISPSTN